MRTDEILNQQNYTGSTLQSTRITISFRCFSFQTPSSVYHFRKINFHSVEETVILAVFKPWQKSSHHLSTNDGEKATFDKILS